MGTTLLLVDQGYWRSGLYSENIIPCLQDGCLGGLESECAEGYEGKLCQTCSGFVGDKYYAKSAAGACLACERPGVLGAKLAGLLITVFLYLAIMTVLIIKDPGRRKDHSVLLRIITNYF